ncbi:MAG: alkaline phosphatase family protein [Acidobacteriota bacterium]|nr:alkaline phosphatase family protein [Acidobacteriota bacterium]
MRLSRRDFTRQAILAGGSVALGCATQVSPAGPQTPPTYSGLPDPTTSGIQHVVVVTMENRSFDHLLGWLPNAAGQQSGLTYTDNAGVTHASYALSGDYTGCPHRDPDHGYSGARITYNGGKMDGFLKDPKNDIFSIGYYQESDIPFYAALARNYTACDQYHASILGPTFPNRMFLFAGQTDRTDDSVSISSLPTILDKLAAANVSHNYYYSNIPYLTMWAAQYLGISKFYTQFLTDAANGTLPAVSFVDPFYTVLDDGTGNDDHPHADIRRGEVFLHDVFRALATGPAWASTVLIINFDEWGGFFEHIAPPRAIAPNNVDTDLVGGKALLGYRLPVVIASPWTVGKTASPRISSLTYDHTSVLKLIEWRWGLTPLTARDASSDISNLAYAFNFTSPQTAVPSLPTPTPPPIVPCLQNPGGIFGALRGNDPGVAAASSSEKWDSLRTMAAGYGFPVK